MDLSKFFNKLDVLDFETSEGKEIIDYIFENCGDRYTVYRNGLFIYDEDVDVDDVYYNSMVILLDGNFIIFKDNDYLHRIVPSNKNLNVLISNLINYSEEDYAEEYLLNFTKDGLLLYYEDGMIGKYSNLIYHNNHSPKYEYYNLIENLKLIC